MAKTGDGFFGQANMDGMMNVDVGVGSAARTSMGRESMASNRVPGTTEILFLKRLLYLKASIDNESTLNTFSVPFEQEKMRDHASPDQLLLDTNAVLSGGRDTR